MTSPAKLSIAVVGPGAIGGTVAAWLAHGPSVGSVTLCAWTPLNRLEVVAPDGRGLGRRTHPRLGPGLGQLPAGRPSCGPSD